LNPKNFIKAGTDINRESYYQRIPVYEGLRPGSAEEK
jgi:hypothetical protein